MSNKLFIKNAVSISDAEQHYKLVMGVLTWILQLATRVNADAWPNWLQFVNDAINKNMCLYLDCCYSLQAGG